MLDKPARECGGAGGGRPHLARSALLGGLEGNALHVRSTQGFGDASPHRELPLPHMVAAGSQARETRKEPHPPVSREMRLFSSG